VKRRYQIGDQALVREINLSSVLRYLHAGEPLSRAGLAGLTGLNKTTVSSLVEELLQRGLIREVGLDNSGSGRPAMLLDLNPGAGLMVGVALGVDFISAILADFVGDIHWRRLQEVDPAEGQEAMIERTLGIVQEAMEVGRGQDARLLGLGIATPGTVDVDQGFLIFSPNLQWHNVAYRQIFEQETGLRVFVDNDANASALAEHLFGAARQVQHFISIFAGVGVGGGLFLNGELYRGAGGFAGEIGHTNFMLEHYRRQDSVIERVRTRLAVGRNSLVSKLMAEQRVALGLPIILQAAGAGDGQCLEALTETGALLGLGIANLINTFNPEMVVFGGPLSEASEYLLPPIEEAIQNTVLPEIAEQAEIVLSPFGGDASVVGAVALAVDAILSKPSSVERLPQGSA